MIAVTKNLWERLGSGEDLLFRDSISFLADTLQYKKNLNRLVSVVYKKTIHLFPDIEDVILQDKNSGSGEVHRFKDPLSTYLEEVKGFGVSTREEETLLARAIEITRLVLYKEIASLPGLRNKKKLLDLSLPLPQIHDLVSQAQGENSDGAFSMKSIQAKIEKVQQRLDELSRVRSLLISRNLHLVPHFAKKYRNYGVPYPDLIQEGNASLLRAADKFDWRKGVRFSTYAQWWIHQAMLKSLYSQSRVVRLPVYLNQKLKKMRDANQESWGESGQNLTPEQMAKNLKEPLGRIRRAMKASVGTYSLDQEANRNDDYSLRDLLVDKHAPTATDLPDGPSLKDRVTEIMKSLPEKERKILTLRFGLDGNAPLTLDEVSKQYHVSRERIRQIQVQALKKLLTESKKLHLSSFLS